MYVNEYNLTDEGVKRISGKVGELTIYSQEEVREVMTKNRMVELEGVILYPKSFLCGAVRAINRMNDNIDNQDSLISNKRLEVAIERHIKHMEFVIKKSKRGD